MDTRKIIDRRITQFADLLGFDRNKISAWGFAQAILAAVWSLDGKTSDWDDFLRCAEALNEITT